MRHKALWLGFIAAAALALAAGTGSFAQPPGGGKKKGDFGGKGGKGRTVTVDQIVDRIMAFDKNNDGKVTKDELPERMQHLIALGDTNKDGALDKQEVQELAGALESLVGLVNPGGPGFGGPKGGGGAGGKGPDFLRALDDLELKGATKEKATSLVREHQEKVRKLQADLLVQMKDVLPDGDFKVFKEAMDRKGPPGAGAKADFERKLDQIQQELDELRRDAKKK